MRAVIVGCGRVGSTLARWLAAEGHQISIVELNVAAFNRLGEDFAGNMVIGNGLDEQTLRRAGIEGADAFAAVTNGDNRNLMMAQLAKEMFRVPRVICRVYDPMRAEVYQELGLETFCSTTIGASMIHEFFVDGVNRGATTRWTAPVGARR